MYSNGDDSNTNEERESQQAVPALYLQPLAMAYRDGLCWFHYASGCRYGVSAGRRNLPPSISEAVPGVWH